MKFNYAKVAQEMNYKPLFVVKSLLGKGSPKMNSCRMNESPR